jgi:hypothetical protein
LRVFVLCTGRCGSVTLSKALEPATNYTVGHETRWGQVLPHRVDYPEDHIEVDNRLAWILGSLGERYPRAFYVHLTRDRIAVARSFNRRWANATMRGYRALSDLPEGPATAMDYVNTVNSNIRHFLRDKRSMTLELGSDVGFEELWSSIEADGDFDGALAIWNHVHNSQPVPGRI